MAELPDGELELGLFVLYGHPVDSPDEVPWRYGDAACVTGLGGGVDMSGEGGDRIRLRATVAADCCGTTTIIRRQAGDIDRTTTIEGAPRRPPAELGDVPQVFVVRDAPRGGGVPYTYRTLHVYSTCMSRVRTNIELEDAYVRTIMDRYGVHTKTEAVNLALRHLAGQPMSREEALAMRGARAVGDVPVDIGPTPPS